MVWFREPGSAWLGYGRGEDKRSGVVVGDRGEDAGAAGFGRMPSLADRPTSKIGAYRLSSISC